MEAPAVAANPPQIAQQPPLAAPQLGQEPARTDSFAGLPTRSPQAALDAVDATPALIPLENSPVAETEASPAPPSAFAAFAFGVNRGLEDINDDPKPQFSNEGDDT